MSADDDDVRARLAALEAEVRADTAAQQARKEAALAKVREQRARQEAERQALRERQAEVHGRGKRRAAHDDDEPDTDDLVGGALTVAKGARLARTAKAELQRPREKGEKSWLASTLLSTFFGPVGWLYAGSLREAIPASVGYILAASILTRLPLFLLMPVMMVAMPVSGIAGLVYAIQHNRHGKRMRLFDKDDDAKAKAKRLGPGT
ncbi:MAG: hypothetical protein H6709_04305 [Kofleriaceae bacterium]|nr:hypothetical protein [Kofleriaceae bacterium]MCB9571291.1 hypothetical protein [Kofleriaceae bacterium]